MSLESSYEHAEQEPPRSATPTEADHGPVVRGNNEGEQPPADVSSEREALISNHEQALQRAGALKQAGNVTLLQYWASGQMADLNRAMMYWQESLTLTPPDSPDRPALLSNLGNGLRDRYDRTGELTDLKVAIDSFQQAVQVTPSDSPDRPALLNNLGNGLRDRYARTGELTDLEAAITAFQQAVQTTLPDSPDWLMYLSNLGNGLRDRYARTGELTDLEAAIMAWEKSWSISHPRFAALAVTYQLGQQRQETGIAVRLVTTYLERARQHRPRTSHELRNEVGKGSGRVKK